ncbi:leucine-rich repeat domain-containing protein [Chaetoceros tenuissimus]|uniref:Leucine-rich repeat domain-containing protein n=1 Tax=Chaetoceros tenuissimus TaxID=426638 RepID=A0AAD3CQY0_9STRA|nr:leucine-rich repeat domain-containing protein [Chaetoceros tenuissimus]
MRVQTEEWQRFIPRVRMYKGKKTYFYNGREVLWDNENQEFLTYGEEEQMSWEVIIVLPGVQVIPRKMFISGEKLEAVIMSDSVQRIEYAAFGSCRSLTFVKLSRNLEYIGLNAFEDCKSLTSIFIPPSCREIGGEAFYLCSKLIIFNVPRHTELGHRVIANTSLIEASPFKTNRWGDYENTEQVHEWVKNINQGEEYELHQVCSSINPMTEIIYGIVKRKGLCTFHKINEIVMTPFDYLKANPFIENEIDQRALMKRYILEMLGETA